MRPITCIGILALAVAGAVVVDARQDKPGAAPGQSGTFGGDAAVVVYYVRADRSADFEAVLARVKEALQKSRNPVRKQQAAGWKVFKSPDPVGEDVVLYVFAIDPAVKGASYSVGTILSEAFPGEAEALYKKFGDALSKGQLRIDLNGVMTMGSTGQ